MRTLERSNARGGIRIATVLSGLLLPTVFACAGGGTQVPEKSLPDDDPAIYASVIENFAELLRHADRPLVVSTQTMPLCEAGLDLRPCVSDSDLEPLEQGLTMRNPGLPKIWAFDQVLHADARAPLGASLRVRNSARYELKLLPEAVGRLALVLRSPLELISRPSAFISVSRPAIHERLAMVVAAYMCTLCGRGSLFLLEHRDGVWQVIDVYDRWMS